MSEKKLRVAVMETGGWGGIHYYAYALCNALAAQAVEVVQWTHEQYELQDRPHRFERLHLFRREPYLRTLYRLRAALRRSPDILHVQSLLAPRKDALLFWWCRRLGIRVVLTVHNVLPHEPRRWEAEFYAHHYRRADALILHCEQNRRCLLELVPGLDPGRLFVIPHGNYAHFRDLELGRQEARERLGLPLERRIALFFGAIRPYKGLDLLLAAIGPVRRACPEAFFAVAGHVLVGERAQYERQAASLGLGAEDVALRFAYLSTAEAIAYVCACDLVVLPYRQIYQSGVLLWAYSFGRPVLATRVGAFPESVEEGRSGWLVAPGDRDGLQRALIEVLQDPEGLARAGVHARTLADTCFGWEGIAEQTTQVYRWLMQ